jgi:hypothetical protein
MEVRERAYYATSVFQLARAKTADTFLKENTTYYWDLECVHCTRHEIHTVSWNSAQAYVFFLTYIL